MIRWVKWRGSFWHTYDGAGITGCGVFVNTSEPPAWSSNHPPRGGACGNCLKMLAALAEFANGALVSQRSPIDNKDD